MQRTYETIPSNPALSGLICVQHDVVFAGEQHADLIVPCKPEGQCLPAIVFIQGSAWCFPDRYRQLPSLAGFAKMGLVVMTITHRNCMEGHPFPAFLQDSKAAVRFLRAHAEEYGVDSERIGVWGTSSGGNTAQLIGLTPNAPCYRTADWANVSDSVSCVVSCFGPTDVPELVWGARASQQPELIRIVQGLTPQCAEPQASYEAMSPIYLPLNAPPP
ncbi:MAG: alpha/beta hydrolase, partial [Clostridia bacterium]